MSEDPTLSMIVPAAAARAAASPAPPRLLPASLGSYRILSLIGEGGMGTVYTAEQQQPRRIVALKVIRAGVASPRLLHRFEQEAEALGRLHHPGIAQVYEAGTADTGFGPQPYFAMEFIEGRPLTQYADTQALSTRERLALMAKICDAVHHAHQRGIIHRDLKPGNILVDESGQPKILDFGVARVTDSDSQATRETDVGTLIGTLAYMSPEQVLADPLELDTRSDVYALGVILYELLSGRLPYDVNRKLLHQAVQAIREEEPPALSSVNRMYRGDVETIVAKALEKDKSRRYSSAADLGADIRRYLNDEPILARPPTTAYQVRKFARRHKGLVGGLAAVFAVLIVGIAASTWQAVRATRAEQSAREAEASARAERDRASSAEREARRERDRAVSAEAQAKKDRDRALVEKQRADSEAAIAKSINEFLQFDLLAQASSGTQASGENKPDPDIKVRTVLDRAAARIEKKFDRKPAIRSSIESTIGKTYEDLGLYAQAQRHFESALNLKRRTAGREHPDTLGIARELGGLYRAQGKYAEAETLLTATLESYRRVKGANDAGTLSTMDGLGTLLAHQGKFARAEPLLLEAYSTAKKLFGPDDPTTVRVMLGVAGVYFRQKKPAAAEPLLVAALSARRRTLGPDHPSTVSILNNLGVLYHSGGRLREAEPLAAEVLQVYRRTLGEEHINTLNAMSNLGVIHNALGKDADAEPLFAKALEGSRKLLGPQHARTLSVMNNLGLLYSARGRREEAEAVLAEVWNARRRVLGPEHPDTLLAAHNLAQTYIYHGKISEAEALANELIAARRKVLGPEHAESAASAVMLGELRYKQGNYSEAESLARNTMATLSQNSPGSFRMYRAQALLGASLCAQRKFEECEPALVSGYDGMKERGASTLERIRVNEAAGQIVRMYTEWGKPDKAAEWRQRLGL